LAYPTRLPIFVRSGGDRVALRFTPPILRWTTRCPAGLRLPLIPFGNRPPDHPLVRDDPSSDHLLSTSGLRRHFSACAGIVCAHLPLGRVRGFCRLWSPTAQLRARRYTNRSKRCGFPRRESCYLASFRHAKATRQPRPALTVRAELGIRNPPEPEVITRADSRFPSSSGMSPTACAFR
jgi:hypothetical protein